MANGTFTQGVLRLTASLPTSPAFRALPRVIRNDAVNGGQGSIAGTVYLNGPPQVPAARRVLLHDRVNGLPIRETWSDAQTGAYTFERIRPGLFYVVAFDHTGNYNAVIKDRITPV